MVQDYRAEYVAGGWPGERYEGTVKVSLNVEYNEENSDENIEAATDKARQEVANKLCMKPSEVRITDIYTVVDCRYTPPALRKR